MVSTEVLNRDVQDHDRRIESVEEKLSETRSAVVGIDKILVAVNARLDVMDGRWKLVNRLILALVCGVGALVGNEIWHNLIGH